MNKTSATRSVQRSLESLGASGSVSSLPFSAHDVTAGSESELQAIVIGDKNAVDLPRTIERSNYYANIARRIAAGDAPKRAIVELDRYLNENEEGVWENSWVRFPERVLSRFTRETFQSDLLADKRDHRSGLRSDLNRFIIREKGETFLRVPVSYLLKLSLAEAIGSQPDLPSAIASTGVRVMSHFLNDNTSPETFSFHILQPSPENGVGRGVAHEKSKRFLLSQLLAMYANRRLGLGASGQRARIYFAPHPPLRQKQLNNFISDAFYRELFMSPCLSGWDEGESKHAYMSLCHQVLSRSQLNAVAKLREAGVIVNNLVVLPNLSTISLANNGTHVSLGSRMLTEAMRGGGRDFGAAEEKLLGDLTIKIVEHFLPLFVGAYNAAPYRFDFADFHPEKVLGFLPHELDYTHLRMIWRRWRKKADLNVCGYGMTPFGPPWVDRGLSALFRLRGDWVTDSRLIDYPVALMSTERSPALDGAPGNCDRLKRDLADLGVFDARMPVYLPYRLREFATMGFSGFEGRHYSKNTRTVTVIDTDVSGGTNVGLVAMIEVTALMIGEILQCYSRNRYDEPQHIRPGMFLSRGCPKSLYRPGGSTDVLILQRGRVRFDEDLIVNRNRTDVQADSLSVSANRWPRLKSPCAHKSRIRTASPGERIFPDLQRFADAYSPRKQTSPPQARRDAEETQRPDALLCETSASLRACGGELSVSSECNPL